MISKICKHAVPCVRKDAKEDFLALSSKWTNEQIYGATKVAIISNEPSTAM